MLQMLLTKMYNNLYDLMYYVSECLTRTVKFGSDHLNMEFSDNLYLTYNQQVIHL